MTDPRIGGDAESGREQGYFPPPGYPQPGYSQPGAYPPPGYPQPGAYPQQFQQVPRTNGMAIASLIVSLVSLGPVGFVLGLIALRQIKTTGEQGRGMAIAGTIIGAVGTLFWVAAIVLWIFFLVAVNNELSSGGYN